MNGIYGGESRISSILMMMYETTMTAAMIVIMAPVGVLYCVWPLKYRLTGLPYASNFLNF